MDVCRPHYAFCLSYLPNAPPPCGGADGAPKRAGAGAPPNNPPAVAGCPPKGLPVAVCPPKPVLVDCPKPVGCAGAAPKPVDCAAPPKPVDGCAGCPKPLNPPGAAGGGAPKANSTKFQFIG